MIHARDNGRVEYRDALAKGLNRIIQQGLEVRIRAETEASDTLLGAIGDEECSIRKRSLRGV